MASHTAPTHKREIERAKAREVRPAHFKKTGAPPGWTPELLGNIVKYMEDVGHTERAYLALSDLSAAFGLPPNTLEGWYLKGLKENDDSPLRVFAVSLARSRANGKEFLLNRVQNANDWRASMELLSRIDPHNYSEKRIHAKVQHEHTHSVEHSIDSVTESLIRMLHGGLKDEDSYIDVTPRELGEST